MLPPGVGPMIAAMAGMTAANNDSRLKKQWKLLTLIK
jgi:hypothetical protein